MTTRRVEAGQRDPIKDQEISARDAEKELAGLYEMIRLTEEHIIALKMRARDIEDKLANARAREESKRKVKA